MAKTFVDGREVKKWFVDGREVKKAYFNNQLVYESIEPEVIQAQDLVARVLALEENVERLL